MKPERVPSEIMARILECTMFELMKDSAYQTIAAHLMSYHVRNIGWDEYAIKVEPKLRELMKKIFQECRENGFFNPRAIMKSGKKEIIFSQVVDMDRNVELNPHLVPDLCYFCERRTCEFYNDGEFEKHEEQCRKKKM